MPSWLYNSSWLQEIYHKQNFIHHISKISLVKVCKVLVNHGLPKVVNHNIAQQAKQQSVVHVERTCRILSCSIVSCQISQEGGNLPSWSKKQRVFSLRFLSVALSVSLNWFSTKETTFCRKVSNFAYFSHIYSHQIQAIQIGLSEQRASLCYTNRWLFKNKTRTRPPTCKITPWTSNFYELEG